MLLPRLVTLEADLVFELDGDTVPAGSHDLFDIELGENGGHSPRLTISAGRRSVFERVVRRSDTAQAC